MEKHMLIACCLSIAFALFSSVNCGNGKRPQEDENDGPNKQRFHGSGSHGQGRDSENEAIPNSDYAHELREFLAWEEGRISNEEKFDLLYREVTRLELEMNNEFDKVEGELVKYYTYLLIDPTLLNLPNAAQLATTFSSFLKSIFYIGKGTEYRAFDHMTDILNGIDDTNPRKRNRIMEIWSKNAGVIISKPFQYLPEEEALNRESAMMEAIGLANLTNILPGEPWRNADQRKKLGTVLLWKAFQQFKHGRNRPIKKADVEKFNSWSETQEEKMEEQIISEATREQKGCWKCEEFGDDCNEHGTGTNKYKRGCWKCEEFGGNCNEHGNSQYKRGCYKCEAFGDNCNEHGTNKYKRGCWKCEEYGDDCFDHGKNNRQW